MSSWHQRPLHHANSPLTFRHANMAPTRLSLSDSDSDSDSSDLTSSLPFPRPIPLSAFSSADEFSPADFLSSLVQSNTSRHQTLEDLRAELKGRSAEVERDLSELVNREYVDFVQLGAGLGGGENKVEELKVGVLRFRGEVEVSPIC